MALLEKLDKKTEKAFFNVYGRMIEANAKLLLSNDSPSEKLKRLEMIVSDSQFVLKRIKNEI